MATGPASSEFHFHQGLSHVAERRWQEARASFEQAILLQPNWVDAYNNLGGVLGELGQLDEASIRFQQALRLDPNFVRARGNLALIFLKQDKLDDAETCFRQHIAQQPDSADSYHNVAIILHLKATRPQHGYVQFQKRNWLEEAVVFCQQAIHLRPNSPQTFYHQGRVLQALGRADEAAASFMQAAQLDPHLECAHYNLADYYKLKGEPEKAIACYRRVLALQPANPTAQFLLAATSGKEQPASAPPEYLIELFDDYAERFDDHLLKELGYRGPQLLRAAIPDQPGGQPLDILDLGCGTGLTGAAFRDLARTLVGVDLSPQMLARAGARGIYNRLLQDSVPEALEHVSAAFDLILAGDLLVYVGDLTALFPAIRKALRPGGRFVFQVEAYEQPGFALRSSVRFAHSAAYVRELANTSGLTELSMRQEVLRTDNYQDIAGYIFVFSVPG